MLHARKVWIDLKDVIWERLNGISIRTYTYNDNDHNRIAGKNNTNYYYNAIAQRVRKSG